MSNVNTNTITLADLQAQLQAMKAENARLKADAAAPVKAGKLYPKVSQKGAVSLYGMGRFPVTLYPEQWAKIADAMEEIKSFIAENKASLKFKAPAGEV
jgi:hypothetical protein